MNLDDFINKISNQESFDLNDGADIWSFGQHKKLNYDQKKYIQIAISAEDYVLVIEDNDDSISTKNIFILFSDSCDYYCFSLIELFYRKELISKSDKLKQTKKKNFETEIDAFSFDLGCLYWIATGIYTSVFEEKFYSESRNQLAVELLKKVAEFNDPRACSEIASYYLFEEENEELYFFYLKKATIKGDWIPKKELVEYIIEKRNFKIELVFKLLSELRNLAHTKPWSIHTEANLYLKGICVEKDLTKGLQLLEEAATLKHPIAMADLSYFLFHGFGCKQDKYRAKNLLEEANRLSNGRYSDLLKFLN